MPFVMNSLDRDVSAQAHGKWFTWKPHQIKEIQNNDLAMFFTMLRSEDGLVGIADAVMDLDKSTEQYIESIEQKRKEGVEARIRKLDQIILNLEQSLRSDLEKANIKADPLTYASKGELAAYKERATLMEFERKQSINVADEIRKVKAQMEAADGGGSSTNIRPNNTGHTDTPKSTKGGK